mmetsp:Transcript_11011/g.30911  ORF Transcript_11011/g.30911 Transcript_11011/m.30911 type:complete len:156 (+) Transcript_11011:52-519(+)
MPHIRFCLLSFAICSVAPTEAFGFGFSQLQSKAPKELPASTSAATAAAAFVSLLSFPSIASSADVVRGKETFDNNCAGCHVGGANLVKPEKNLQREALARYVSSDLSQAEVQQWVQQSGQHKRIVFFKMPDGKMKEADWADVTTYVVDQALNDKW